MTIEQGTPVQLPDDRIGNVVGWVNKDKVRVNVGMHEPKNEKSQRIVARLEEVELPEKDLKVDFEERNEHLDRNGEKFYTNQHGERIK